VYELFIALSTHGLSLFSTGRFLFFNSLSLFPLHSSHFPVNSPTLPFVCFDSRSLILFLLICLYITILFPVYSFSSFGPVCGLLICTLSVCCFSPLCCASLMVSLLRVTPVCLGDDFFPGVFGCGRRFLLGK